MTDEPIIIGGRYQITGLIGTDAGPGPCDATDPPTYSDGRCRCVVCARCGKHTGNSNQGHFWAFCKVTKGMRDFHLCCPGDCELEALTPDSVASAARRVLTDEDRRDIEHDQEHVRREDR